MNANLDANGNENFNSNPIALQIDSLVLQGFEGINSVQLGRMVEQELTRLFAEQGIPSGLKTQGHVMQLDGGSIVLPVNASAEVAGVQIAQAVYRGLEHRGLGR